MGPGGGEQLEDRSKIRVTNVSEEATEGDLRCVLVIASSNMTEDWPMFSRCDMVLWMDF